jgi:hypothetical protein
MDPTDRLAAATIVATMITTGHPLLGGAPSFVGLDSIARLWFDCAQALAKERQEREFKAGSR